MYYIVHTKLYFQIGKHLSYQCQMFWSILIYITLWTKTRNKSLWYYDIDIMVLTHWGRVTHICVGKLNIIGSDNGLTPGRLQAIIWTNAGILVIGPLGTNFSEISSEISTFSFKKMRLKVSSAKWRPFCLGPNVKSRYHSATLLETKCPIVPSGAAECLCWYANLLALNS